MTIDTVAVDEPENDENKVKEKTDCIDIKAYLIGPNPHYL